MAAPAATRLQARDVAALPSGGAAIPLWVWAIGLGVVTALSRVPFRSRYLFAWDSASFALALDQYNVAFHQPQPPGYPLYVAAARLARLVFGEANASYVALSIVASGLAVTFLTLAAGALYGRTTALLAATLLATSSVFWSQGVVAYPYAFLACFSALVAWLCACLRAGTPHAPALTVLTGGILGLAAGFRTELLPFLAPLWLYASLGSGGAWRARAAAVLAGCGLAGLAVLAWYVPMVALSGGWAAYQAATASYYAYFIQTTSGAGKLLLGLLENTRALVGYLYNGLGLALLPMLYFLGRYFAPPRLVTDRRARFVLLWLLPPLAFYVAAHIGNPGYVLSVVPALCVYTAEAIEGFLEDVRQALDALAVRAPWLAVAEQGWVTPAAAAAVAAIGLTNTALFLAANGEGRYREIRQIDLILERQTAYLRAHYPPQSTVLFAYDRSRQYRYYLPEYRMELLFNVAVAGAVTDTSRYWERRSLFVVPPGITAVVFPDLEQNTSDQPGPVQAVDLGAGVRLYVAHVAAGDEVRYGYRYASVQRRT
jgi:4-amino-4-deoxy-L-arabinose transferase-like glycosyltransferase